MAVTAWGVPLVPMASGLRKLRRIEIDVDLLVQMMLGFKGDRLYRTENMPDDVEIIDIRFKPDHFNVVDVLLHSEEFDELGPDGYVPHTFPDVSTFVLSEDQLAALHWK